MSSIDCITKNQNNRFFEQESEPCLGNLMYKEAITKARVNLKPITKLHQQE
jgi:hypothetical protein